MDELKGKLPPDFPGASSLETAGITTYSQLRKAGDVTQVPGIGAATAQKIQEAMDARTPADQFEEEGEPEAANSTTFVSGEPKPPALAAQIAHDGSEAERIAKSGLVISDTPSGYAVGLPDHYKGVENIQMRGPKIHPIGTMGPKKGMTVYAPNGEVYAISEELAGDISDWIKVHSPTGVALIP